MSEENMKMSKLSDIELKLFDNSIIKFTDINKDEDIIFIYLHNDMIDYIDLTELLKISEKLNRHIACILFSTYNKIISIQLEKNIN